jgi:hypothetical protein
MRFVLSALAFAAACGDSNSPSDPNGPGVLTLSLAAHEAPADGASVLQITVQVDPRTRGDKRKLTVSTTSGSFSEGDAKSVTIPADNNGLVRVGLRAPTEEGLARVRVVVENAVREDSVRFTRAMPEQILVEPEKFALSAGIRNEIKITAQLRRAVGRVTPLTAVSFHAFREGSSEEVGQFGVPTLSDANGQVTVRYTAGNTTYRGRVRIVAATSGPPVVSGSAVIEVTD